jgi:hypothetical protein
MQSLATRFILTELWLSVLHAYFEVHCQKACALLFKFFHNIETQALRAFITHAVYLLGTREVLQKQHNKGRIMRLRQRAGNMQAP